MEAYLFRDIQNIRELKYKTKKKRLNNSIKSKYKIIKTIEIENDTYKNFINDLLHNYKFLYPYISQMKVDKYGIWNCVKIKNKDRKNQTILVMNNGYSYPRFVGLEEK